MSEHARMKHGTVAASRRIGAPRPLVYEAWTQLEHRRHWFAGPDWTEIERSLDLRVGGGEVAHGRFVGRHRDHVRVASFHLVEPDVRLVYVFDMHVAGAHFSVSLAGVELEDVPGGTELTYTEQAFFLVGDYDAGTADREGPPGCWTSSQRTWQHWESNPGEEESSQAVATRSIAIRRFGDGPHAVDVALEPVRSADRGEPAAPQRGGDRELAVGHDGFGDAQHGVAVGWPRRPRTRSRDEAHGARCEGGADLISFVLGERTAGVEADEPVLVGEPHDVHDVDRVEHIFAAEAVIGTDTIGGRSTKDLPSVELAQRNVRRPVTSQIVDVTDSHVQQPADRPTVNGTAGSRDRSTATTNDRGTASAVHSS